MSNTASFDKDLQERLQDPEFKRMYEEERKMLDLSVELIHKRESRGLHSGTTCDRKWC
jgi:hypothetical protein